MGLNDLTKKKIVCTVIIKNDGLRCLHHPEMGISSYLIILEQWLQDTLVG